MGDKQTAAQKFAGAAQLRLSEAGVKLLTKRGPAPLSTSTRALVNKFPADRPYHIEVVILGETEPRTFHSDYWESAGSEGLAAFDPNFNKNFAEIFGSNSAA